MEPVQQVLKHDVGVIKVEFVKNKASISSGPCSCSKEARRNTISMPNSSSLPSTKKNKKASASLNHSVGFLKRIAQLPSKDRKETLKVLKKQDHKRKLLIKASIAAKNSLSNSSNNSNSSVNKDWENWVVLHGKKEVVAEDVKDGKTLGVNFKGDENNSFNLLSKEGKKEWRVEKGSMLLKDGGEGGGEVGEGC